MLKVYFEELKVSPEFELELYDSINRIPFSLKITYSPILESPIYARNLKDGNFIEFRFDKANKNLYDLILVGIQINTVELIETIEFNYLEDKLFTCFIQESESKLEDAVPMKILRDKRSICLKWEIKDQNNVRYFLISPDCLLGINSDSCLVSVILTNLLQENIFDIFGF